VRHHTEERHRQEAQFREENSLRARAVATMKGQYRNALSGTVQQGMSHVGAAAQVATGVFGGFSIADSVASMNKFQSAVTNMSNATYIPDMAGADGKVIKGTPRAKRENIESLAKEVSASSGFDKQDLVGAWQQFIEKSSDSRAFTGATSQELAAGRAAGKTDEQTNRESTAEGKLFLKEMADLAKASGSDLGQIMTAAGMMKSANTAITSAQMAETMRNVVGQGKLGSVSIADLAKSAPTIMAGAGSLAMGQTEGQRALLGLSQISMISAGTAPMAATATARFISNASEKHDKLKKLGIETRDAKGGGLRDPAEILADIYRSTKGDEAKLQKVLGLFGERGQKPITAVRATYTEAERAAREDSKRTGKKYVEGEAGAAAVLEQVQKAEKMGYSKKDVATDLAAVHEDRAEKFAKAKHAVQEQIEAALLPALESFARVVPEITPKLVEFIKFLTENPFQGVGILVGASIAKQMAAAGIQSIMEKALGGVGGPVALAVVAGMLAWKAAEAQLDKDAAERTKRGQTGATAEGLIHDAQKAKTPEEQKKAIAALEEHGQMLNEQSGKVAEGKDHSPSQMAAKAARLVMGVQSFGLSETKGAAGDQLGQGIALNDQMAARQSAQLAKEGTELVAVLAQFREKLAKATAGSVGGPAPTVPMSQRTSPDH
jgi:hypothetical protein